ncbi:MAG TPA: hypothetical protein ENJ59_02380 [Thermofilum sp.]|nr:hypothetical protein [Thermofilum sp.]
MSYVDPATRRFASEFSTFLDKWVVVKTSTGREYKGFLLGYLSPELSLMLGDVQDSQGNKFPRVVISGHFVSEIILAEEPLDLEGFAKKLEGIFPHNVKYYPEAKLITVMDRIKITEKGVEGGGPVADKIREMFEAYVKEWRKKRMKKE